MSSMSRSSCVLTESLSLCRQYPVPTPVTSQSSSPVHPAIKAEPVRTSSRQRRKTVPFKYGHCHSCRKTDILSNLVGCTVPHCRRRFCLGCLRKDGSPADIGPDGKNTRSLADFLHSVGTNWTCLACRKLCSCPKCSSLPSSHPEENHEKDIVAKKRTLVEAEDRKEREEPSPALINKLMAEPDVDEIDGFIIYEGSLEGLEDRLTRLSNKRTAHPIQVETQQSQQSMAFYPACYLTQPWYITTEMPNASVQLYITL